MKAVQFDASLFKYIRTLLLGKINRKWYLGRFSTTKLVHMPEPELPNEDWVKIKTSYAGICGSDLNVAFLKDSPSTSPFVSFPFVFGHEVVGNIVSAGKKVEKDKRSGRVVINPLLSCEQRNIDEPCGNCKQGRFSLCENFAHGTISPGMSIGLCKDTGGGWGEYFVAHKSQVYKVPDDIDDEDIVFADPLASALHPILRNIPENDDHILIIGMGVIGLLMVAALRALGSQCNITVLARHKFQGELAASFGADDIVYTHEDYFERFRELTHGKLYQPIIGKKFMIGGFNKVYDCVSSNSTLDTAMKFTNAGGDLIVVGLAAVPKNVDWSPVWFKEINIKGSFYYYKDEQSSLKMDAFEKALQMISNKEINLSLLLTHTFKIEDYKKAIQVASEKSKFKSIKTVFKF